EVAQVIRDPLALETERAKPDCARRRRDIREALDRLCVRPRVGDGAVPRDSSGELRAVDDRQRFEALLDALVRITEALLEAQHLLADDLEAEVAGLDDAGVYRPHRNLVDTLAFDPDERVVLFAGLPARIGLEVAPQRKAVDRPAREPQPRALVVGLGADPDEIVGRTLHPGRCGEDR